jgi:hypothetical protein
MKHRWLYLKTTALFFIIIFTDNVSTLPVSFFIIEPSDISNRVYAQEQSLFLIETPDEDFNFPESANQKTLSSEINKGKNLITLRTGINSIPAGKGLNKHLGNTPFLNTDSGDLKNAAAKFRNSKDPLNDVSVFVYNHISDKKIGIPMISASAVLKQKAGDCTEHSILTVALLRSLNIPARAVVGLILTGSFSGKKNVFVYHMWVEAFKNGKWVMLDSTRPHDVHANRYIALAYHNLMTETPLEFLAAASAVNGMRISYIR